MEKNLKEFMTLSLVATLAMGLLYFAFVLELPMKSVEAYYTSPATQVATVTLTVNAEIEITSLSVASLSPAIYGVTGNAGAPASGTTTFTIITNDVSGYSLTLTAGTSPALQNTVDSAQFFDDYTATSSYGWQAPSSGVAVFGYTVHPANTVNTPTGEVIQSFRSSGGSICNVVGGGYVADTCWLGLSTSPFTILTSATATGAAGETQGIKFQAESNAKYLKSGTYQTVVTITANAT